MSPTKTHVVPPTTPHTHTIIFLHGRGSPASTFCAEIFESQDSSSAFFPALFPSVKWVFPCAPLCWSDAEGEEMHQWFGMVSVQRPWEGEEKQRGEVDASKELVLKVIEEESGIIGGENVVLAGMSQGCAVAMYTLLTSGVKVGGFFGLCGWLPLVGKVTSMVHDEGSAEGVVGLPILLQHCRNDCVVPVENGAQLASMLTGFGMDAKWQVFEDGGHWLNEPEGMDVIVEFVKGIMERKAKSVA